LNLRPGALAGLIGNLLLASSILCAAAANVLASNDLGAVVLLGTAEDEPLTGRIAAELRALGIAIEIRVITSDARGIDREVESALREGARAAVRIDAQTGRTEVSIPDPATRQVSLKQVLEGPPTAALAPVLAVRTVEFVRATLLGPRNEGVRRNRAERSGEGSASNDGSARDGGELLGSGGDDGGGAGVGGGSAGGLGSSAGLSRLGLTLASGALVTPGGLDPQVAVGIIARLRLFPRIGVELMGFTPLTTDRIDGTGARSGAQVSASTWLAGGGLFVRQPLGTRVGVEVAAGAVMAILQTSGSAAADGSHVGPGRSSSEVGASVYGRLGADMALARNLALRLDLLGGGAFRQAKFSFDGNDTDVHPAWGRSFAAALFGVEARW
jgi:hypothetical protein